MPEILELSYEIDHDAKRDLKVATTILYQMGWDIKTRLYTRNYLIIKNGVQMQIGVKGGNLHAAITLNAWDTYDITIGRINRKTREYVNLYATSGIFFDQLAEVLGNAYEQVTA